MLDELGETLCATVAGGCGQAESLSVFGETLCPTVAGGCGQAESLSVFGETLCTTVAGGRGQAESLSTFGETLCTTIAGGYGQAETLDAGREPLHPIAELLQAFLGSLFAGGATLHAHAATLSLVLTTPRPLVSTTLRRSRRRAVGRGRAVLFVERRHQQRGHHSRRARADIANSDSFASHFDSGLEEAKCRGLFIHPRSVPLETRN